MVDFHWPELFEDDISVIFKSLVNAKLLLVGQFLADGKLLVVRKHLADSSSLFSVGKCLLDTKCLASIKIWHIWHNCHIWAINEKLEYETARVSNLDLIA